MSVADKMKDSYRRAALKIKHPTLLVAKGLEGLIDFATPVASVLTVGADPKYNVPEKILYGPYQTGKVLWDSVSGYAANVGIRDFFNGQMGELFHIIGNASQNIVDKPLETLGTVTAAYVLGKAAKMTVKAIRESKEDKYLSRDAKK